MRHWGRENDGGERGQENSGGVLASSFCAFVVAIMSGECASHADVVVAQRGQAKQRVGHSGTREWFNFLHVLLLLLHISFSTWRRTKVAPCNCQLRALITCNRTHALRNAKSGATANHIIVTGRIKIKYATSAPETSLDLQIPCSEFKWKSI